MSGPLRRFAASRRGFALVGFAVAMPVLLGAAAFAVDVGVLVLDRRALQKAVDMAALAAAAEKPERAAAAARRLLDANGAANAALTLRFGHWRADPAIDPDARFAEGPSANAVAVEAERSVPSLFARVFGREGASVRAAARAAVLPTVSFALGSRLASVDPPLVDALLEPLVGARLGLAALDYRGLARSTLRLDTLLRELAATNGMAASATAGEVLRRPVRLTAVLSVAAAELDRAGDPSGAAALRKASRNLLGAAVTVVPGDLLRLDPALERLRLDYPNRALAARVSALSLLSVALTDRSVGNAADASLGVPGLATARAGVLVGEAERGARSLAVGEGTTASAETAQLRASFALEAGSPVAGARLALPLELVAAGAEASVVSATCAPDMSEREVRLAVRPGVARLSLGGPSAPLADLAIDGAPRSAALLDAPLVRVEGRATATLRQTAPIVVVFRGAEIGSGTVKTVRTRTFGESFVGGFLADTELQVRAGPLGLGLPLAALPVREALQGLAAPVDAVAEAALAVAGAGLGEADVRVDDLVCANARIVG